MNEIPGRHVIEEPEKDGSQIEQEGTLRELLDERGSESGSDTQQSIDPRVRPRSGWQWPEAQR